MRTVMRGNSQTDHVKSSLRQSVPGLNEITKRAPILNNTVSYSNRSMLQRMAIRPIISNRAAHSLMQAKLKSSQALDRGVRTRMELAFGGDSSSARVPHGAEADMVNRALNAHPVNPGNDIILHQEEYSPANPSGQELLAREFSDVMPENGSKAQRERGNGTCDSGCGCSACTSMSPKIQRKPIISQPRDEHEQEADKIATHVVSNPSHQLLEKSSGGGTIGADGECAKCREKQLGLHRHAVNQDEVSTVPPIVREVLHSPGQVLDPGTRWFMERRFGRDFSRVRVHTDMKAAQSAHAVNALAYTVGRDVVFGAGQYAPGTIAGQRLMAHELAHTVQQDAALYHASDLLEIAAPQERGEHETDIAVAAIARNRPYQLSTGAPLRIARQTSAGGESSLGLAERAKAFFYERLIASLRFPQQTLISALRSGARRLPESVRGAVEVIIDIDEGVTDLIISLVLAIVSLTVGVTSGLVGLIEAVFQIADGLLSGIFLFIGGVITGDMVAAKLWLEGVISAIIGIPAALKALIESWIAEFKTASTDRQTIMIGELTGQIIALLVPFLISGGTSTAGSSAAAAEEVGGAATRAGATVARWTPVVIEGGGESATAAATAGRATATGATYATEAEAALRAVPIVEVPPPPPLRVVLPPVEIPAPAAEVVTAGSKAAKITKGGIVAGAAVASTTKKAKPKEKKPCRDDPCPYSLPINWPEKLLPLPEFDRPLIRTPAGDRVWQGTERGAIQQAFYEEIVANRADRIPPPTPCFEDDAEANAFYDAHHMHPLFLGGEDAEYNLCALERGRHQKGHPALNNQTALLAEYEACGICSGFLTKHPAGQEYEILEQ